MSSHRLPEELLHRMRLGDEGAVGHFVREFELVIQRSVRVLIRSYHLHRIIDTEDISQSVLSDFFRDDTLFRRSLKSRVALVRLLVRMARNKVLDEARKHKADRRDQRRLDALGSGILAELCVVREATPVNVVAGNELVDEIYSRLTEEERTLARLRFEGEDWSTLARLSGMKPDALRKRLVRAITRVGHELRLERNLGS